MNPGGLIQQVGYPSQYSRISSPVGDPVAATIVALAIVPTLFCTVVLSRRLYRHHRAKVMHQRIEKLERLLLLEIDPEWK